MEVEQKTNKKKYGRVGCFVAIFVLILIIVAMATGLINYPDQW